MYVFISSIDVVFGRLYLGWIVIVTWVFEDLCVIESTTAHSLNWVMLALHWLLEWASIGHPLLLGGFQLLTSTPVKELSQLQSALHAPISPSVLSSSLARLQRSPWMAWAVATSTLVRNVRAARGDVPKKREETLFCHSRRSQGVSFGFQGA